MVLFSFENITRAAGLNATNTLPVSDSARATHESFESHLQLATAPPPRESVESTSRNNRPSEKPSSSSTETRHNATARRDTDNQTKREDDRLVNNDAAVESTTKQPEKRSDLEPEREDRSDAEAVAAGRFAPDVDAVQAQREADDSIDHETPLSEVFEDQISCADIVLLSKADLAGEAGIAAARAVVEAEAPRKLPILPLEEGRIDPAVILGLNAAAENDLAARPSHHDGADDHEHDDFDTVVIELPEIADPEALKAAIVRLAREQNILRVKGYVAVSGKPMRLLVQAVGERVRAQFDRPWGDTPRASKLVVIGEHDDVDPVAIRAVLTPEPAGA